PQDPSALRFQLARVAEVTLLPEGWTNEQRDAAEREGIVRRDAVEFTVELTSGAVIRVEQMGLENDALAADNGAQVAVTPPTAYEGSFGDASRDPGQFDVIIFDRYAPAERSKLPEAGNYIWIADLPDWLSVRIVEEDGEPVVVEGVDVLDWQREHPILRGLV